MILAALVAVVTAASIAQSPAPKPSPASGPPPVVAAPAPGKSTSMVLNRINVPGPEPTPTPQPAPVIARASIDAPASVPAGGDLLLLADTSGGVTFSWKLISPRAPFLILGNGEAAAIRKPAPGLYRFVLIATGSSPCSFDFDFADVTVEDRPSPQPGPVPPTPGPAPLPPTPTPTPTPTPPVTLGVPFFATLVVDSSVDPKTVLSHAAIADSTTIADSVLSLGGTWNVLDRNSEEFARRKLAQAIDRSNPLPQLVIQSRTGKLAAPAIPVPLTEEKILDYLKSLLKGGTG